MVEHGRGLRQQVHPFQQAEAYVNSKLGKQAEARAALGQLLQISSGGYVPRYHIAIIYHGLDEPSESLLWLERGFEERDPTMVFLKVDPRWKTLRESGNLGVW